MILGSYAFYPMGYYELQPVYECKTKTTHIMADIDGDWTTCTNQDFCENLRPKSPEGEISPKLPPYRVVEDDPKSLNNWIGRYDM